MGTPGSAKPPLPELDRGLDYGTMFFYPFCHYGFFWFPCSGSRIWIFVSPGAGLFFFGLWIYLIFLSVSIPSGFFVLIFSCVSSIFSSFFFSFLCPRDCEIICYIRIEDFILDEFHGNKKAIGITHPRYFFVLDWYFVHFGVLRLVILRFLRFILCGLGFALALVFLRLIRILDRYKRLRLLSGIIL